MYDFQSRESVQITDNKWEIEYDLAVSDSGDYAFVSYNRKSAFPQLLLNGVVLENLPENLNFKKLSFVGNNLIFIADNLTEGNSNLMILDCRTKNITNCKLPIAAYQIVIDEYDKINSIYLAGTDIEKGDYCILRINDKMENCENLYRSNNVLYVEITLEHQYKIIEISGNSDGLYTLFAYNEIYGSQYLNPFSGTNNYCGRLSWYQSNRLLGLLRLFEITGDKSIKKQIVQTVKETLSCTNENIGIVNSSNPPFLWSTMIYGVNTNEPDTLLVNQACIINALLAAVQKRVLDDETSRKIIEIAEMAYDYYEQDYSFEDKAYHFRFNSNFYLDGVFLPFNQQNMWGITLCRLYEITEDDKYKARAKELALTFKKEFVYTEDDRLIWHYWPEQFYKGWEIKDNVSIHTPERRSSTDCLYEDISHSGINVAFIIEYTRMFGYDEFTKEDIEFLSGTLDGIIKEDGKLSYFISGDVEYQKASRFYYISPYWAYIDNKKIQSHACKYLKFFQEWDQTLLLLYANCLRDVETAYINVNERTLEEQRVISRNKKYCGKDISGYIRSCYEKQYIKFTD